MTTKETSISAALKSDLAVMAEVGAKAHGAEITIIQVPTDLPGLPAEVPASIVRGDTPSIGSVHGLLEQYRLFPARKKGCAQAQTLGTFIELTNRHTTSDSAIFADANWKSPSLTAVIDYHVLGEHGPADNCTHRVHYAFPLSDQWKAWIAGNEEKMSQENFAMMIEDRIMDIAAPTVDEKITFEESFKTTFATPNELILLSRGLQVNVSSKVKKTTTLQSGEGQLLFEETHEAKDSDGGTIKVPGLFILAVPMFFMGEVARIPVRLRYRVIGGSVVWLYQMYRPDAVITDSIMRDIDTVKTATELPVYTGSPEISA